MQKNRRAARKPLSVKKHTEKIPLGRMDWICIGTAAALCIAMLPSFLILGANTAFLHFCVPAYSVLEQAEPATVPAEPAAPARRQPPVRIEVQENDQPAVTVTAEEGQDAPRILIYHTHATEAYLQTESETYRPCGSWRTEDASKSVVAVGAKLKALLETEYGLGVLHDTTNYEPPKLASAYSRSLVAMQSYQARYPSLSIFIDVHRDAYGTGKDTSQPQDFVEIDGKQTARLMFVVGTGEGATGAGFAQKPDFESNLALAKAITGRLKAVDEQLTRDIRIKTGRYNQHVSSACLLVEVGHNANTLTQALNAVPYLAEAIAACMEKIEMPAQLQAMSVWSP